MKLKNAIWLLTTVAAVMTGCGGANPTDGNGNGNNPNKGEYPPIITGTLLDDRDGKTYKTVKINGLWWMAENLNYDAEGSVCYDDDPANCATYGRLYDWVTAMNIDTVYYNKYYMAVLRVQGVCPDGWSLPLERDVIGITTANGYTFSQILGIRLLAQQPDWLVLRGDTTTNGFSAIAGGWAWMDSTGIDYSDIGTVARWHTSSQWRRAGTFISDESDQFLLSMDGVGYTSSRNKASYFASVRCVQ